MNKTGTLLFGSAIAAAMFFGGVIGATVLAKSAVTTANAASPTPTPSFKSNEAAAHETGETAAREAAENSGIRPAGPAGAHPIEAAAHEAGESAAREAAETAGAKPSGTP
jgi:hypothetical protein